MKPQTTMYRSSENKKPKITQIEKRDNFIKKLKLKAANDAARKEKSA